MPFPTAVRAPAIRLWTKATPWVASFTLRSKKQVVVYQSWAVGYFDEDILPHAGITGIYAVVGKRQTVVMEQVLGHTGALGLPVQPQASGAVVDVISPVNNVNGSMHFDPAIETGP